MGQCESLCVRERRSDRQIRLLMRSARNTYQSLCHL
jgi:hypothetical protein